MISIRWRHGTLGLAVGLGVLAATASALRAAGTVGEVGIATPPWEARVLRTGGLRVETAALLWSGQQGGPVALAARAVVFPGGDPKAPDKVKIALVVEAAGGALARAADDAGVDSALPVDIAIYALDARGALATSLLETVEIPNPKETLRNKGLRFVGGFALRPGSYRLRILVGHAATKTFGLRTIQLDIPTAGAAYPLVAAFSAGSDPGTGWLTVSSIDAAAPALPSFWPLAARPLVAVSGDTPLSLFAVGLPAGTTPRIELRAVGASAGTELSVREVARAPDSGFERIDLALSTLDLPPGSYELRAALTGAPFGSTADLTLDLVAAGDPARTWVEREEATAGAEPAATGGAENPDAPGRWRRSEAAALRAVYRRALALLASGDEEGARAAVTAFEVPLLSGPNAANREELAGLLGEVLRALERRNPESLVPLMALYRILHGEYQTRKLRHPSMHAAILVGSLAELYARAVPTAEGRRLAAGFLISLTPNLFRSGLSSMVEAEFRRAKELDPDHPQALLGRALDDERHGRYAEAESALERLAAQSPDDGQVAVRLAINTARLGQTKRARELFGKLVAPLRARSTGSPKIEPEAWPVALACQELARLEIAAKEWQAAADAIDLGLLAFPDDEKLLLLSTALADLDGSSVGNDTAAKARLAQWAPQATSESSPRLRYGELPSAEIEALWQLLRREATERLPALGAALGTPSGNQGKVEGTP